MFHSRVVEKLLAAGYALRKTKQDFEISMFTEEEIRIFCKRTVQINKLEETHRSELQKRTDAIVRAGAKRGVLIDYESTYQAELAKMRRNSEKRNVWRDLKAQPWRRLAYPWKRIGAASLRQTEWLGSQLQRQKKLAGCPDQLLNMYRNGVRVGVLREQRRTDQTKVQYLV